MIEERRVRRPRPTPFQDIEFAKTHYSSSYNAFRKIQDFLSRQAVGRGRRTRRGNWRFSILERIHES